MTVQAFYKMRMQCLPLSQHGKSVQFSELVFVVNTFSSLWGKIKSVVVVVCC